jgi:hypothetical protein
MSSKPNLDATAPDKVIIKIEPLTVHCQPYNILLRPADLISFKKKKDLKD